MTATRKSISRRLQLLIAAPVITFLAFGCGKDSVLNPNAPVSPTYSSISSLILQPSCVSCHGGASGYSFDTYANSMKAVKAGDTTGSPLFTSVKSGAMPTNGNKLSQEQVQAIGDWIMANAPDN
jgi:cytochrome c553